MNYWLLLVPLLGALSGFVIIHVLFTFLFHPRAPKKIAGLTIQGILPGSQPQLATSLGKIGATLFASGDLEKKISDPASLQLIMPMIENHIDDFLRNKLTKELPVVGMFVGDKTIGKVKEAFMKEIVTLFPQVMREYAGVMKKNMDPQASISAKLAALPLIELEQVMKSSMKRELQLAKLAGAGIGLLFGLIQLAVILCLI